MKLTNTSTLVSHRCDHIYHDNVFYDDIIRDRNRPFLCIYNVVCLQQRGFGKKKLVHAISMPVVAIGSIDLGVVRFLVYHDLSVAHTTQRQYLRVVTHTLMGSEIE